MYRDDHEAALARVQALETELAAHTSDDRKIAALTREIADARTRVERAEAELQRMRSAAPSTPDTTSRGFLKSSPTTSTTETSSKSGIVTLVLLFGGLGAVYTFGAVVHRHHEAEHTAEAVEVTPVPAVGADRVLADGVARAIALAPGAELVAIDATGVHSDGDLDPQYGELAVELVRDNGPERIAPVDPNRPIGAPEPEHEVYLRYDCIRFVYTHGRWNDEWPATTMDIERLHSCIDTFETHPALRQHCTIAQIWQRARDAAPATAIAKLTLDATGWTFTIDDPRLHVERHDRDDC